MRHQIITPDPFLAQYVKTITVLDNPNGVGSSTFKFFADGCPGLFFQHGDSSACLHPGNKKLSQLFIYGQTVRPIEISITGSFRIIYFQFYPHSVKSLYGLNARELTDTCADLTLLPELDGRILAEKLMNTADIPKQVEIMNAYLTQLIRRYNAEHDNLVHFAVSQILQTNGKTSLREIHHRLRVSERTFERRFERSVGVTPRLFARICSFNSAMKQMQSNSYKRLSDIAFDNGYSDQSHFIRTFREFTGLSPLQFQKYAQPPSKNISAPGL